MKNQIPKGLPPTEAVERLVNTLFDIGFEVYGNEHVEVTICPEFARGNIAVDNNGNKIYTKNEDGSYPLSVAYVSIEGVAVEGEFKRPYNKLSNLKFYKFESLCVHVGSIGKMLNKKGVRFVVVYHPYYNSSKMITLFDNQKGIDPDLLKDKIKDLVRKSKKGELTPHHHFDKTLSDFIFK